MSGLNSRGEGFPADELAKTEGAAGIRRSIVCFTERTGWLARPPPGALLRLPPVDPAPSLSSDLVAYCGSLVA